MTRLPCFDKLATLLPCTDGYAFYRDPATGEGLWLCRGHRDARRWIDNSHARILDLSKDGA